MSKEVTYSKEQLAAITESGQNILVSASAGSGKTTVLIERIVNKIKKQNVNVDELLIVTFTEASANEMKQRLRIKLSKEILLDPSNHHLRKQLMLLANANISTFHSFCNSVIQKFFYLINLDSKYKIAEEIELFLIAEEVLEELFIDLYEEKDPDFLMLVDRFTSTRSDDELKNLIFDLFKKVRNIPNKEEFLQDVISHYDQVNALNDFHYINDFYENVSNRIKKVKTWFQTAYDLACTHGHPYDILYQEDISIIGVIEQFVEKHEFNALHSYLKDLTLSHFPRKKNDCDPLIKDTIKNCRDQGKAELTKLKENYFSFKEDSQLKFIKENKKIMEALFKLMALVEVNFSKAKRDKGIVDFSDLEEFTLRIFKQNQGNNDATHYYRHLFKEILVDEYQDTNSMQETIIQAISNGQNVFTVGDVKQSIYRFRNAEPEIFQQKYKAYGKADEQKGKLINLNANFRSREDVLDFINYIFSQIMNEEVGEILYDDLASLKFGQKQYPKLDESLIHLAIIDRTQVLEEQEEEIEKLKMEAHYVAKQIRKLFDEKTMIFDPDQKEMRLITYKDIVILSRSVKNEQPMFNDVFKEYNIPLLATDLAGYFNSIEVLIITSLLEVIDNPLQDIPLVAVLRSPLFEVNEQELIQIKVNHQKSKDYFFDQVKSYISNGPDDQLKNKLYTFMTQLNRWRELVRNTPLSEVLFDIYHQTNYYDYVKGQYGGRQRQANLDLLFERSKQFEELSSNSLFKFVRLIQFLKDHDKDLEQARTVSDNEDLVRFMSIHKSKGLEFPIVFIINLSKKYNTSDEKDRLLFDKDLGIATSYFDFDNRVSYDTFYQTIIKDKLRKQLLAEEMRLLYVALTRAKERLYLVATVKEYEKLLAKYLELSSYSDLLLPASVRQVDNYLELILMALIRHPEFKQMYQLSSSFVSPYQNPKLSFEVVTEMDFNASITENEKSYEMDYTNYTDEFKRRLEFSYTDSEKTSHFAKISISDIKRMNGGTSQYSYNESISHYNQPSFINKQTATSRGTTYHRLMQHINFKKEYNKELIQDLLNRLVIEEILTQDEALCVDVNQIVSLLSHDITKSFQNAKDIRQELPFTTLVDAKSVYPNYQGDDYVLVQGVMDLLVIFDHQVYLIDFKSDRIKNDEQSILNLKQTYQTQIGFYKRAVEQLIPNHHVSSYLYLFEMNEYVKMD